MKYARTRDNLPFPFCCVNLGITENLTIVSLTASNLPRNSITESCSGMLRLAVFVLKAAPLNGISHSLPAAVHS